MPLTRFALSQRGDVAVSPFRRPFSIWTLDGIGMSIGGDSALDVDRTTYSGARKEAPFWWTPSATTRSFVGDRLFL